MKRPGWLRRIEQEADEAAAALPLCCGRPLLTYLIVGADLVKIGWTSDLTKRAVDLQTSSPVQLRIVALARGGLDVERALHLRLAPHRKHGEWFAAVGVLAELRIPLARARALHECLDCSLVLGRRGSSLRVQRAALARYHSGEALAR